MNYSFYDYDKYCFDVSMSDGVALVEFNDSHRHNMWSMPRMAQLTQLLTAFSKDETVRSVMLFSGVGRSFGVGGNFHETSKFTGGDEVDTWIDHITDLYIACLKLDCPMIAAIDGYAIGIGLQIALTADYRIGSDRCILKMPEFELGIACTFGGYMLEKTVGRSIMQKMLMSCDEWSAGQAVSDGLLHEVVPVEELRDIGIKWATHAAAFAPAGFRNTKPFLNSDYIEGLNLTRIVGKQAHRAAFAAGEVQQKMKRIISGGSAEKIQEV
ncbi:MAG: enoyl-CoA hydratase/isomerase family protein [Gloeotrichia echinulata DEX184]|nr:enoyl-CoA hydratase/isomerase family protein [Gloeotrichia echinulata DEX184]